MRKYERLYNEAVYEGANDKRIAVTASDFIFDEISNKRNDFIEHEYNDDVITDILKTLATIYYSDICNDEELFEEST